MRYDAVLIVTVFILGTMAIVLPPLCTLTGGGRKFVGIEIEPKYFERTCLPSMPRWTFVGTGLQSQGPSANMLRSSRKAVGKSSRVVVAL